MKYIYTVLILILLLSNSCNTKQPIDGANNSLLLSKLELELQIPIDADQNTFRLKKYNNSYFYYGFDFESNRSTDSFSIYKFSHNASENIVLYKPNKNVVLDFVINDSLCFVIVGEELLKYNYKNNKYIYDRAIKLESGFARIEFCNGQLALYPYLLGKLYHPAKMAFYDINTMNQISSHIFDTPKGASLTYEQPKQIFFLKNDKIILSDITDYNIRIYDIDFKLLNQINYKPQSWSFDTNLAIQIESEIDFQKFRGKISVYRKMPIIQSVDLLNDSTLIVCRTSKNEEQYYYDIWQLVDDRWVLLPETLIDYNSQASNISNLPLSNNFYTYFCNYYRVLDGKIILLREVPFDVKSEPYINMTNKEFMEKVDNFYTTNPVKLSAFIYDFKEK